MYCAMIANEIAWTTNNTKQNNNRVVVEREDNNNKPVQSVTDAAELLWQIGLRPPALCSELADRYGCERVSLCITAARKGAVKSVPGYVRRALEHEWQLRPEDQLKQQRGQAKRQSLDDLRVQSARNLKRMAEEKRIAEENRAQWRQMKARAVTDPVPSSAAVAQQG